jgi:hypothetical protein
MPHSSLTKFFKVAMPYIVSFFQTLFTRKGKYAKQNIWECELGEGGSCGPESEGDASEETFGGGSCGSESEGDSIEDTFGEGGSCGPESEGDSIEETRRTGRRTVGSRALSDRPCETKKECAVVERPMWSAYRVYNFDYDVNDSYRCQFGLHKDEQSNIIPGEHLLACTRAKTEDRYTECALGTDKVVGTISNIAMRMMQSVQIVQ